jgi:hypothetical protein
MSLNLEVVEGKISLNALVSSCAYGRCFFAAKNTKDLHTGVGVWMGEGACVCGGGGGGSRYLGCVSGGVATVISLGIRSSFARASALEGQSLCLVCESVIRLANKTSVSTEINCPRILHAIALVPVCESRVDRGQRGFSVLTW